MGTITIKNLIGGSINIVTGGGTSERWVEPQYTDEWVSSDGKTLNNIIFGPSGPENLPSGNYALPTVYRASGNTYDATSLFQGNYNDSTESDKIVKMEFNDSTTGKVSLTIYRKYTPGHWEDADGNWINGSWSDWEGNLSSYIEWNTTFNPPAWCNSVEPYTNVECFPNKNDKNANLFIELDSNTYCTRTWNNTKPSPAA